MQLLKLLKLERSVYRHVQPRFLQLYVSNTTDNLNRIIQIWQFIYNGKILPKEKEVRSILGDGFSWVGAISSV